MILDNKEIVWTPTFANAAVGIALNREFAEKCQQYQLPSMLDFTNRVWMRMGKKKPAPSDFIDYDAGILPKGLYAGHDGVWLSLDIMNRTGPPNAPLRYHDHNAELATDQQWLLRAFAAWAETAYLQLGM